MQIVVIWLFLLLNIANSNSQGKKYCPPNKFVEYRSKRHLNLTRTAIITEVHGQKEQTGLDWGIFVHGELVSRYLYHHIAILGFDHVLINCIYNATIHVTPPTVEEIYPPDESCVSAWNRLGFITWRTIKYAGPVSDWPIHPDTNKPDLEKDLYKNLRGINPVYNEIKKNKAFDWVMIMDMDELLLPVHWKPKTADWCKQSVHPTILESTLSSMLTTATRRYLWDYEIMNKTRNSIKTPEEACKIGYSPRSLQKCGKIASIMFPVYWWSNALEKSDSKTGLPKLRFPFPSAYEADLRNHATATEEWDGGYQTWKSLHQVAVSPELKGILSMHQGGGNKILAPRRWHGGLSFELAHVKLNCPAPCEKVLVKDHKILHLYDNYDKCINGAWESVRSDSISNSTIV